MPSRTVSAVPAALVGFAARTRAPAEAARAAGSGLDARLAAAARGGAGASRPGLGAAVRAHAGRALDLGERTAGVGVGFAIAGGPLGLLSLAVAGTAVPPEQAAALLAAVLNLPLETDGTVERPDVDPVGVSWLAAALGPDVIAAVAARHPHLVGPVDGMPVEARYAANRPLARQAGIDAGERQLLFIDPARGLIAEVLGDLRTADHVAVVVPGMGNTMGRFDVVLDKARALRAAATGLHPPEEVATVAWLGYDSPGVDVVLDDDAVAGGPLLVRAVAGLPVGEGATLTVVAHSYGTVVAGRALREGLDVDAVALTGSPGVLADHTSELGSTPVYALRAPGDYVSWSEHFGTDPSDPDFGATRLDTGDIAGHSSYFDAGTEALRNLALVATGRAAEATVVEPSRGGWFGDVLEDVHDRHVQDPIDGYQELVGAGAGVASDLVDALEAHLPEPVAGVVDGAQDVAGAGLEVGSGLVDLGQRVTSPDFVEDVVGDVVDIFS